MADAPGEGEERRWSGCRRRRWRAVSAAMMYVMLWYQY